MRKFILVDAKDQILGRISTQIAQTLMGKNKVDYNPSVDAGDWVIVTNSDRVRLSGEKESKKEYFRYSGYHGGIHKTTFKEQMEKDSAKVILHAVKGMLPKNTLGREALTRLRVFKNEEHPYADKIENGN